jgi:hypothetical protein
VASAEDAEAAVRRSYVEEEEDLDGEERGDSAACSCGSWPESKGSAESEGAVVLWAQKLGGREEDEEMKKWGTIWNRRTLYSEEVMGRGAAKPAPLCPWAAT